MKTKIAIACDDLGFETKEAIKKYLIEEKNADVVYDPVQVPEDGVNTFAKLADEMSVLIQKDVCRLGIYICGTGIGFTCQANKHWGIRATAVTNPYSAKRARLSNNVQIIGLGLRVNGLEYMKQIIDAWYDEPFEFSTARENSKNNLLEAEKNDNLLLKKPVIFLVFMVALGRPLAEAIQSAMKVGIGFIALSMVIGFMLEKMEPAITGLAGKTGSSLDAIDVGGAATAVMGFGSSMGAIIIPLCVGINLLLLVLKITDCVNVDVFNLHQNASMGAIVAVYSGNFLYGVLTAGLFHVWALIAADLGAKNNEKFFGLPQGVSISHPVANTWF